MDGDNSALWLDLIVRGWEAYNRGFSEGQRCVMKALALFDQAASLLRGVGDEVNLPLALSGLGASYHALGTKDDLLKAKDCYDEEIRLWRALSAHGQLILSATKLQGVLRDLALLDTENALLYVEEGLSIGWQAMADAVKKEDYKDLATISLTTGDLCVVLAGLDADCSESHLEAALGLYQKALDVWERTLEEEGDTGNEAKEGKVLSLLGMAEAYIMLGRNLESAGDFLQQAQDHYEESGRNAYHMGHVKSLQGRLFAATGQRQKAVAAFAEAQDIFKGLGFVK